MDKPRIVRHMTAPLWVCSSRLAYATGETPAEAYSAWKCQVALWSLIQEQEAPGTVIRIRLPQSLDEVWTH